MNNPDTRPGEMSTLDARKIAKIINEMTKEQGENEFRTEVLVRLERLQLMVDAHEKKFTVVQSGISDNTGTINKIIGALIFIAALGGVVTAIVKIVDLMRGR